jgi:hypothetical protein
MLGDIIEVSLKGVAVTIWELLEHAVAELPEPMRRSDIVGWFRKHHPEVNEQSLAAHIQGATANASDESRGYFATRAPLLERVDRGLYRRWSGNAVVVPDSQPEPAPPPSPGDPVPSSRVVLVSCTLRKLGRPAPARDLYRGTVFDKAREYAEDAGLRWFVVSAKYGLLDPDDVVGPYDLRLEDREARYREVWGRFVAAQLAERMPLSGATVEAHASRSYVEPLREPLERAGATLVTPLEGLRQGERLSWYGHRSATASVRATLGATRDALADRSRALSPAALRATGPEGLETPGLYAWWVDEQGAGQLSVGLGHDVAAGLIYLGQAGAARRDSSASGNTLRGRLLGMHLGGRATMSTFRRTLAACLRLPLALRSEDDPQLSDWMEQHLTVTSAAVPDRKDLRTLEPALLEELDPPLNLNHMPRTALRANLSWLRNAKRWNPP